MDKFIVKRTTDTEGYKALLVSASTHEKLLELKQITGTPIVRMIDQMVDFCAERLHVEDDK